LSPDQLHGTNAPSNPARLVATPDRGSEALQRRPHASSLRAVGPTIAPRPRTTDRAAGTACAPARGAHGTEDVGEDRAGRLVPGAGARGLGPPPGHEPGPCRRPARRPRTPG